MSYPMILDLLKDTFLRISLT